MGTSVITGAKAVFIPSFNPYVNVCEITNANSGPGENPADNPKVIPASKKLNNTVSPFHCYKTAFNYSD